MQVTLLREVFANLYERIKIEAGHYLEEKGKKLPSETPLNQFIGFNTNEQHRERNISYAIQCKLTDGQPEEWILRKGDGDRFNARILYDLAGKYNKGPANSKLEVPEPYLGHYLEFVGKASVEELCADMSPAIRDAQVKLLHDSQKPETLHYRCFHWSDEKEKLVAFRAQFDSAGLKGGVVLNGLPSGYVYRGTFKVMAATHSISIRAATAESEDTPNVRPLSIQMSKVQRKPFRDMEVCVGCYLNISTDSLPQTGYIVFERVAEHHAGATLDSQMLAEYLRHLSAGHRPEHMAFLTKEDFGQEVARILPEWHNQVGMLDRFKDTRYIGFVLTDKDHPQGQRDRNYLDLVRFCFDKSGRRFTCEAAYPNHIQQYKGDITYLPPYKLLLNFEPVSQARYQVVLDTRRSSGQLRGVYSGISQEGSPAAGRVILYRVGGEAFEREAPRLFDLTRGEHLGILAQYRDLLPFFRGAQDYFVDNPAVLHPRDLSFIAKTGTHLDWVPGVYYYYRTRKIRGKVLQVKQYPILIYKDGRVRIKVQLLRNGPMREMGGFAFREQNGRIYIHQEIGGRYGGLCIMYPDYRDLPAPPTVIRAVYASASQSGEIFAGRMYFVRQSEQADEALFDSLSFDIIDTGQPGVLEALPPETREVVTALSGQLNNYLGFRDAREKVEGGYGHSLFLAACEYGRRGMHDRALHILQRAILRGGFHDAEALREVLLPADAPLSAIREELRAWPSKLHEGSDGIPKQDEHDFVAPLLAAVFG